MKKYFAILLILFVMGSSVLYSEKIYKIGWENWSPYQYLNEETQQISGLDVELARAVFDKAGLKTEFVLMPWIRLLTSVQNGSVDVAMSASITEEREEYAYFSDAYRQESWHLFIRKSDKEKYAELNSIEDILNSDIIIGTISGYYYGEPLEELIKILEEKNRIDKVIPTLSTSLNYVKLKRGRIDALIENPFVGNDVLRNEKMNDKLLMHHLELYSSDVFFMLSKSTTNQEIVDKLNIALSEIKNDGTYQQIINKYME